MDCEVILSAGIEMRSCGAEDFLVVFGHGRGFGSIWVILRAGVRGFTVALLRKKGLH